MPNHVTNVIRMSPKAALSFTREPTHEEATSEWNPITTRAVDFSLVVPEPENIERGGCSGRHDPGVVCWYEWNQAAWGTKWNAYSSSVEPVSGDLAEVRFDTAWTHPAPVIQKLSKNFPDEEFFVKYADEDRGYNIGEYVIVNGEVVERTLFVEGTFEAADFATQVREGSPLTRELLLEQGWHEEEVDELFAHYTSNSEGAKIQ